MKDDTSGGYDFDSDDFEILCSPEEVAGKSVVLEQVERCPIDLCIATLVDEAWAHRTNNASGLSPDVSKPLYRYEGHQVTACSLVVAVSKTDYREVYGTNIANPGLKDKYGLDSLGNALGVCCLVRSLDGKYLLLRRSDYVLEMPDYFHVCAGRVERYDAEGRPALSVADAIRLELAEELSARPAEIRDLSLIGLCRSRVSFTPELLFRCRLSIEAGAFADERLDFEHKSFFFIDQGEIPRFLLSNRDRIVPSGKACLVCDAIERMGFASARREFASVGIARWPKVDGTSDGG